MRGIVQLIFCLFTLVGYSQLANVTYSVQTVNVTSYENATGGACWEAGDEEYTSYVNSWDNVNGATVGTGCLQCNSNGNCSYAGNINLQTRTNNAYTISSNIDAWEDDGCGRCSYEGGGCWGSGFNGDDCRRQQTASYNFREQAFPSNGIYTNGPTWGSTADHQWTLRTTWRYSGTTNLITPTCTAQNAVYAAGAIRSWSVNLTAGVIYNFNNCLSASSDTYMRIYGPDGFSIVAQGDDNCGVLSSINYTAATTGTYYIELSQFSRGPLSAGGTLTYSIVPKTGANISNPIAAGTLACGVTFLNVQSNVQNTGFCNDFGQASDDIYYSFTLSAPGTVNISHCGSGFDTYVSLLNSGGGLISSNDDNGVLCAGTAASLQIGLAAGTYYVVSEGYNTSAGNINTQISIQATNNPGAITAPTSICVGGSASISNVTAATGASSSDIPSYYYYWQRTSAPVVGWTMYDGPTTNLTSALPATVTNTPGTYILARNSAFQCFGQVSAPFINLTVDAASTLGTLSNPGPIDFCNAGGNFTTAANVSGQVGSVIWDWGSNNGVWNDNWVAGANSGICCFPKKVSNSDGNADRIRYRVTNGSCPVVTSGTILIRNRFNEAPTNLTSSASLYCLGSGPANITLTATFPSNINMNGTVRFYSASCGGTLVGTVSPVATSNQAVITIPAPVGTTTYFVRYEPGAGTGCSNTACVSTTVTVNTLSVAPTSITGTTTICSGGSTTLTLSGGTAGTGATAQWFAGSCGSAVIGTGNSINVSPTTTTTYFVRYTGTCNTTTCASQVVTVTSPSTAGLGTGDYVWRGATSNDWTVASNWFVYDGSILVTTPTQPSVNDNVFIDQLGTCVTNVATISTTGNANNVTLRAGGRLNLNVASTLNVHGSFYNNSAISPNLVANVNSNVIFPSSANFVREIGGNTPSTFGVLTNDLGGGYLDINQETTVSNILNMNSSFWLNNRLILGTSSFIGILNHTWPGGGWMAGPGFFRRYFAASTNTAAEGNFPLGAMPSIYWRQATLQFTTPPITGGWIDGRFVESTLTYYNGLPILNDSGVDIDNFMDEGYWELNPGGGLTGGIYTLTLQRDGIGIVNDPSQLRIIKSPDPHTTWIADGAHGTVTGGTTAGTISRTGMSGFSYFLISSTSMNPLPIELSSFAAICNETGDAVKVQWTTASESNTSHFDVERSLDGLNWEILGRTAAAGNSTVSLTYSMEDNDVRGHSIIYYRLNQFDLDGASKLYGPTSAECKSDFNGIELFPNPAGTEVSVLLHGDFEYGVHVLFTDMNGKEVKKINYSEEKGKLMTVDLRDLEPGVYVVRVKDKDSNSQFVRLIKQ